MNLAMKIIKSILNIIMTIIIIVGSVFVILFCIGIQPYVVESGSMQPDIPTGSLCFINKKAKYENMKVGDIIAFKINSNTFATHRIVSITNEGFETKGDANNVIDNIITTKDNYIGQNIFSIPYVGLWVLVIQTTRGKIILGTIIIVLFLAAILIGQPSRKKQKVSKKE